MNSKEMKQVIKEFKERDNFLITSHINPEGDSVGSQLAVMHVLEKLGKHAVMVNQDEVPENLRFLPGVEKIEYEMPGGFVPGAVVFLDCPVKERSGYVLRPVDPSVFMINIDHHVSNEYYSDVNWVEPEMSSVGEMAYHLIREVGCGFGEGVAMAIYTALITDTGMFNYDNTARGTHMIAGDMIREGVSPKRVHREVYEKKPLFYFRVLGRTLETIAIEENGLVAHMTLTRRMLEEEGVNSVATEEFIGFPRSIKGVEVAVFFNESLAAPEHINVSFRSNERVDVNRIAARFGGGGHNKASGCILRCPIEEARQRVLEEVRKAVNEKTQ